MEKKTEYQVSYRRSTGDGEIHIFRKEEIAKDFAESMRLAGLIVNFTIVIRHGMES